MKDPRIKFIDDGVLEEILDVNQHLNTEEDVVEYVLKAQERAIEMANKGVKCFDNILSAKRKKGKKAAWESDPHVSAFFGPEAPSTSAMRTTRRRLNRARRRVEDRTLKYRLRAQSKAGSDTQRGENLGTFLSVRTFKLYPSWFKDIYSLDAIAMVLIHELMHDWFFDQYVEWDGTCAIPHKSKTGWCKVSDAALAKKLAQDAPKDARKNPENFEQFLLAIA